MISWRTDVSGYVLAPNIFVPYNLLFLWFPTGLMCLDMCWPPTSLFLIMPRLQSTAMGWANIWKFVKEYLTSLKQLNITVQSWLGVSKVSVQPRHLRRSSSVARLGKGLFLQRNKCHDICPFSSIIGWGCPSQYCGAATFGWLRLRKSEDPEQTPALDTKICRFWDVKKMS